MRNEEWRNYLNFSLFTWGVSKNGVSIPPPTLTNQQQILYKNMQKICNIGKSNNSFGIWWLFLCYSFTICLYFCMLKHDTSAKNIFYSKILLKFVEFEYKFYSFSSQRCKHSIKLNHKEIRFKSPREFLVVLWYFFAFFLTSIRVLALVLDLVESLAQILLL